LATILVCVIFALVSVLLLIQRLHYGISLTDESYYLASSLSFVHGARPFHSLLGLHQFSALLEALPLQAYITIAHTTERLMLVSRALYLTLGLATAICFYAYSRKLLPAGLGLMASLSFVTFIPFALPNLSYNTLGMNFFAIGASLLGLRIEEGSSKNFLKGELFAIAAGLAFFMSMVSHPAMLIPTATLIMICWRRFGTKRIMALTATISLALLVLLIVLCIEVGVSQLGYNLKFSLAFSKRPPIDKLFMLCEQFLQFCQCKWYLFLCLLPAVISRLNSRAKYSLPTLTLAIMFPLALAYSLHDPPVLFTQSHDMVLAFALVGLALFSLQKVSFLNTLFWTGIIGGLATSFATSSNGLVNFCVGGFLCVPSTTIEILQRLHRTERGSVSVHSKTGQLSASPTRLLMIFFALLTQTTFLVASVLNLYGEYGRSYCVSRIHKGVFRGLFTNPARAKFIETLQERLALHEGNQRSIRVIGDAGGYLLSSLHPSAPTLNSDENKWFIPLESYYKHYYEEKQNRPDLVVVIPKATGEQPSSVETAILRDYDYRVVENGPDFTLYKRTD
jgi:hypothetical protein